MARAKDTLSLKSRGKKPLASLNTLVLEQLRQAPKTLIRLGLEDLIARKAPDAPKAALKDFAAHLMEKPGEAFSWDDGSDDGRDFTIELTAQELDLLLAQAKEFVEEDLPEIIPDLVRTTAASLLKSLKADWPAQRAHEEAQMDQFCENLRARWGHAFDTLRMMYTISTEIGNEVVKSRRRSHAKKAPVLHDTMVRLHARACQVTLEIITLMERGFADGAMARWRTLHEITIVAALLVEHGEDLAVRYRAHEAVESKRAMDRFALYHEQLGYGPPSAEEIEAIDRDYEAVLARFGDRFGSEYGWAAFHLDMKKPRLVDLEAALGRAAMQSYYRMASYNVHAGTRGLTFRLGILEGENAPIAIAGASNAGFVDPARNTASDLTFITSLLSSGTDRFDRMVEWQILINLRDELPKKLDKAQRELDRACRAQLKMERQAAAKRKAKRRPQA
ncbi:hypothetical protein GGC65_003421 [Sphingopyxis sp. OAS728]|uniref:DUF5677 domain-containing protein n=1 Tax=Sphingopyxis sp. OAS728 TaxID=2663823 RepID=UPI00178AB0A0|nr:DUF5677 domain-containing protein [Sphingopyxis sp. OAS728]MBE1528965.1 hypothetical protein [Sphingopyxis sp. OAS728]